MHWLNVLTALIFAILLGKHVAWIVCPYWAKFMPKIWETAVHCVKKAKEVNKDEHSWHNMFFSFVVAVLHRALISRRISHNEKDRFLVDEQNVQPVEKQVLVDLLEWAKFADWAYPFDKNYSNLEDCLNQQGYSLHSHVKDAQPGRVAHYVAINHTEKIILIVPRGSWSTSDIVTNLAGLPVDQQLEQRADDVRLRRIWSHEGFLTAATALAEEYTEFIESTMLQNDDYNLQIVGHSLGAAVACLLGIILRSRLPMLKEPTRLQIFAYAPPPCLNDEASEAVAPFVTSIVWNEDVVPTLSVRNFVSTCKVLAHLNGREKEVYKQFPLPRALFSAVTSLLGFQTISEHRLDDIQADALEYLKTKHHEQQQQQDQQKSSDMSPELFVPGKVIYLWERVHKNVPTGYINGVTAQGSTFRHLAFVVPTTKSVGNHFLASYKEGMQRFLDQADSDDYKECRQSLVLQHRNSLTTPLTYDMERLGG